MEGNAPVTQFCDGEDEDCQRLCRDYFRILVTAKQYYDEKYDKISFIKNILIDNIMVSDIYPSQGFVS